MSYYVYVLASGRNGTLYVGVTNDMVRRVYEHREGLIPGFTKRYRVHQLVHWEEFSEIAEAIAREKRVKRWLRKWKLELIEQNNPTWRDLYEDMAP